MRLKEPWKKSGGRVEKSSWFSWLLFVAFFCCNFPQTSEALATFQSSNNQQHGQRQKHHDFTVNGQRARLYDCQSDSAGTNWNQRPLVVIPGMAQTISTWDGQATIMSRDRIVLVCEPLGVGLLPASSFNSETSDFSLPSQAQHLFQTMEHVFPSNKEDDNGSLYVDLVGFSLGGRISLAFCQLYPHCVDNLHVTGVAMERTERGRLYLAAWRDCLEQDDLRGFAWCALLASYSPSFLTAQKDKIARLWIPALSQSHSAEGLLKLMQQTHSEQADDDKFSVQSMVESRADAETRINGHLCVGEVDEMVSVDQVKKLAQVLDWDLTVIQSAGHAVPMEAPRGWRESVLSHCQCQPRPQSTNT